MTKAATQQRVQTTMRLRPDLLAALGAEADAQTAEFGFQISRSRIVEMALTSYVTSRGHKLAGARRPAASKRKKAQPPAQPDLFE